jgi:hypothetical protein
VFLLTVHDCIKVVRVYCRVKVVTLIPRRLFEERGTAYDRKYVNLFTVGF